MSTQWVTFYSYKGGVGRTMALANVGAQFAKEGRRVLFIDFDLEAPGLDSFSEFSCATGNCGVVEYVWEYLQTGIAPDVESFVHEPVDVAKHIKGKMWIMPSGRKDLDYNRKRASINWTELYDRFDGKSFINNWKAQIEAIYAPDYVFIDSRTGLTEIGGVCTLHLPDLVVLLFALNDQNLLGVASVVRAISAAKGVRIKQLLRVATPVPNLAAEKSSLLQRRLETAEKIFGGQPDCQIMYDPRLSLKESIVVWTDESSRLCEDYSALRKKISDLNFQGVDFLFNELALANKSLDRQRASALVQGLLQEYGGRADTYMNLAKSSRAFGDADAVEIYLRKTIEVAPTYMDAFIELFGVLKARLAFNEIIEIGSSVMNSLEKSGADLELDAANTILAPIYMTTGNYSMAAKLYEKDYIKSQVSETGNRIFFLADNFNFAEARRRAGEPVPEVDWFAVISIYEESAQTIASVPLSMRLNFMQAMHIAYAILGNHNVAVKLLENADDLTSYCSPRERVFSVDRYYEILVDEFREVLQQMRSALLEGKLWDGYPV